MSRTVSVAFDSATGIYDLDGSVVSQLEALRQRVREAVYLRFGEWMLERSAGLDRDLIIGHNINLALGCRRHQRGHPHGRRGGDYRASRCRVQRDAGEPDPELFGEGRVHLGRIHDGGDAEWLTCAR